VVLGLLFGPFAFVVLLLVPTLPDVDPARPHHRRVKADLQQMPITIIGELHEPELFQVHECVAHLIVGMSGADPQQGPEPIQQRPRRPLRGGALVLLGLAHDRGCAGGRLTLTVSPVTTMAVGTAIETGRLLVEPLLLIAVEPASGVPGAGARPSPLVDRAAPRLLESYALYCIYNMTILHALHSCNVIGTIFETASQDGNPTNKMVGMQTVNVNPGGGMMVEFRLPEAGKYPFVTHSFVDATKGAVGALVATHS
jgi:hypothetical protein